MDAPPFALRASGAPIWVLCHGFAQVSALYPELPGDDEVREEGTACHWVAHRIGQFGEHIPVGTVAPNGVTVDEEMLEAATGYVAFLRSWGLPVQMELSLPAPNIHPQCGGQLDAVAIDYAARLVRLADLKYGYRGVDPFENWQLLVYLAAIIHALQLSGLDDQYWSVEFNIYQPRDYGRGPVKTWRFKMSDARGLFNILIDAAHNAMSPRPTHRAGPHCLDCRGRHDCVTLKQASSQVLDFAGQHIMLELPPGAIGDELRMLDWALDILTARRSGLADRAAHLIGQGAIITHYDMERGNGKKIWKDGKEAQAIAFAKLLGVDIAKAPAALTPTQAQAKMANPELLAGFIERRSGAPKLTRIEDNRARKLFTQGS